MHARRLRPVILLLLATTGLLSSPTRADQVDDYVQGFMQRTHTPGVAVAVVRDGRVEKLATYGDADAFTGTRLTTDHTFQIASATKMMTGVALMRMARAGLLSLDDNLRRHFPEAPESWSRITLRHLATHASGLPDRLGLGPGASTTDIVAAAQKAPLDYEPGSRSRYGFTDFVVLQAVIEKKAGQPFPAALRTWALDPLGMQASGFPAEAPAPWKERAATIHVFRDDKQGRDDFGYTPAGYSAGGLLTSITDMARFAQAIDQGTALPAADWATLWQVRPFSDGKPGDFGIGWTRHDYRGHVAVGHSGGPALADLRHFPGERLTIVALTNQRWLYPLLAEGIADFYVSDDTSFITDDWPEMTQRLRHALDSAAAGRPDNTASGRPDNTASGSMDRDGFTDQTGSMMQGFFKDFGSALLTGAGPVTGIRLMEQVRTPDGRHLRRYRVDFQHRSMVWLFGLDAAGKVDLMRPASDNTPFPTA